MIEFLLKHGFEYIDEGQTVLDATFTGEKCAYLLNVFGIEEEVEEVLLRYDLEDEEAYAIIDGWAEPVDAYLMKDALEGDLYD